MYTSTVCHNSFMETILITGASGDIGRAVVTECLAAGYTVIAVMHSVTFQDSVDTIHPQVRTYGADVTQSAHLVLLAHALEDKKIDWVVAAHGYIDTAIQLRDISTESLEKTFAVNVFSLIYLAQAFVPQLIRGMLALSSTASLTANGKFLAYSASKAAVNTVMQGFARSIPDRVFYTLCPGPTAGQMRTRIGAQGGQEPAGVAQGIVSILQDTSCVSGDIYSLRDGVLRLETRITD